MQSGEFQQRIAGYDARVRRWLPDAGRPQAVVQVIHGMAEHSARYARLAAALTAEGHAVYAHDLPGHGPGAAVRGHFADHRGWRIAVASVREVQQLAQREQRGLPVFLFGHSMGSFLLQHYVADAADCLAGAIFSATRAGLGPLRPLGLLALRLEARAKGRRHPSAVGEALSFRSYNRAFSPARTGFDWLSRDPAEVDRYVADPWCGFRCTTRLWIDLLKSAPDWTVPRRVRRIRKNLPVLIVGGSRDPVSEGERGLNALAQVYRGVGLRDVEVRVYEDARHELLNETCRDQVTADLLQWLRNHRPAAVS